jgi:hypothetical protein
MTARAHLGRLCCRCLYQDLTSQTLVPQTPRSNSRISIVTAPSNTTAREYLQASQTSDESRRVHAVWVVLGPTESQVAQQDISFGGTYSDISV